MRRQWRSYQIIVVDRRALLHLNLPAHLRVFDAPFYDLFCRFCQI
jgi:hypothetical protein